MTSFAELLSLFLTVPTIVLAAVVIYLWGPKALSIARIGHPVRSADWFIIGVTIGFVGQFFDNLYWAIPWSLSYIESQHTDLFMFNGVWFNIPSRQLCGIIAAYCHIKSYILHVSCTLKEKKNICILNASSFAFGLLYILILFYLKN